MTAAGLRTDEALPLEDPEMVRGDAVLEADRLSHLGERRSGMVPDETVHEPANFPLEDRFPSEPRALHPAEDRPAEDGQGSARRNFPGGQGRARRLSRREGAADRKGRPAPRS